MADLYRPVCSPSRVRKEDTVEYRLIFMVSFVIFLVAALVARVLPRQWRPYPSGSSPYGSIFDEAKSAANTFVPFAFMG